MLARKKTLYGAAAVLLAGFAGLAHSTPVTYTFTGGYITLSATVGSTTVAGATTIALSGNQATFDAQALTLNSFQFTTTGSTTIALSGAYSGESVTLSNLIASPGTGYTSSAVQAAPGTYTFAASPVNATGSYALSGILGSVGNTNFNADTNSLSGLIQTAGDQFALNGITLGTATVKQGPVTTLVTLKADVVFLGATPVPLPATAWLFGSGLTLLGLPFIRRRRTA